MEKNKHILEALESLELGKSLESVMATFPQIKDEIKNYYAISHALSLAKNSVNLDKNKAKSILETISVTKSKSLRYKLTDSINMNKRNFALSTMTISALVLVLAFSLYTNKTKNSGLSVPSPAQVASITEGNSNEEIAQDITVVTELDLKDIDTSLSEIDSDLSQLDTDDETKLSEEE